MCLYRMLCSIEEMLYAESPEGKLERTVGGKYSLWFPCYLVIILTFIHMHVSNLIYPKDIPRYI
jgi:hypothetical protein